MFTADLLACAAAGRIFRGLRLLQILRGLPSAEVFQRKADPGEGLQRISGFEKKQSVGVQEVFLTEEKGIPAAAGVPFH